VHRQRCTAQKGVKKMMKNIHILMPQDLYERLITHYPGRGEISNLFRRIAELICFQLEQTDEVNIELTAKAVVKNDVARGLK